MQLRSTTRFSNALRRIAPRLFLLALVLAALPAAQAQSDDRIDLSGAWKTQAGDKPDAWGAASFNDAAWPETTLPAPQGVGKQGFVWYRKHFQIPAEWADEPLVKKRQTLIFDAGVLTTSAVEVYVNGYPVQLLGKQPTDPTKGTGFTAAVPLDPTKPDILAEIGVSAPDQSTGETVKIMKFGADNVIALRVYTGTPTGGITGGSLGLVKPSLAKVYPYTRKMPVDDNLFDVQHPVTFDLTFGNPTSDAIKADFAIAIKDDEGKTPVGYASQDTPVTVKAGRAATLSPQISFVAPGFYTFTITGKVADVPFPDDTFVVGYDAPAIHAVEPAPADFAAFWNAVKTEAASKPLNVQATPDTSTAGVSAFKVQYDGIDGKPAYAWLSLPASPKGKVPAVLEFPPYDQDFTGPNTDLPAQGVAVMRFIATAPDWTSGNANADYVTQGIGSQKTYVYRTIVGNALRAFDILSSRPEVDASHIGLAGVSQGGGLALITAGLLKAKVKAVLGGSPFLTYFPHSIKAATEGPYTELRQYLTDHSADAATLSYFDTVHFSPAVTAPVYLPIGLLDPIAPPYSSFATANDLKVPYITNVDPSAGHVPAAGMAAGYKWLVMKLR